MSKIKITYVKVLLRYHINALGCGFCESSVYFLTVHGCIVEQSKREVYATFEAKLDHEFSKFPPENPVRISLESTAQTV